MSRISAHWVLLLVAASLALLCSCARLPRQTASHQPPQLNVFANQKESASININTASTAELEKLPGIGKVLAARIIEHRRNFGFFRRPEHLITVRGISDKKFRDMRHLITIE